MGRSGTGTISLGIHTLRFPEIKARHPAFTAHGWGCQQKKAAADSEDEDGGVERGELEQEQCIRTV